MRFNSQLKDLKYLLNVLTLLLYSLVNTQKPILTHLRIYTRICGYIT